jgi:hypothetical protein
LSSGLAIDQNLAGEVKLPNAKKKTAGGNPAPERGGVHTDSKPEIVEQFVVLKHPGLLH